MHSFFLSLENMQHATGNIQLRHELAYSGLPQLRVAGRMFQWSGHQHMLSTVTVNVN